MKDTSLLSDDFISYGFRADCSLAIEEHRGSLSYVRTYFTSLIEKIFVICDMIDYSIEEEKVDE